MSRVIDTNIVQMKFDNEQFERNVAQSMSTLDKLKEKVVNANSGNSLKGLQQAMSANAIDVKGISAAVDQIQKRFSVLGIAGMTVISELTKSLMGAVSNIAGTVKNLIYTGGLSRALNIEQARFQITGLKKDWNALSKDIDYAVSGTAYGFDAAAKAAAQLSASGVEAGDAMKAALRGISGVAAMANTSYEDISPIFTTIAGQGKLMTMQLRQLESRGLNVAATLGEQLGYTEAQIREMVTEGTINFEMFSAAMDEAFGEHAKDANKTFTGVIANIKAAFSRIGADFITPIVTQESPIVIMLQKVREKVVDIKEELQPLVKLWVQLVTYIGQTGQRIVSAFDIKQPMHLFYDGLHVIFNIAEALYRLMKPLGEAFRSVFPKKNADDIFAISDALVKFSDKLKISDKHMEQLKTGFTGIFNVIKLIIDGISGLIRVIFNLSDDTEGLSDTIFNAIEAFGLFLTSITDTIRQSEILQDVFGGLKNILSGIADALGQAFEAFGVKQSEGIAKFSENIKKASSPLEIFGVIFSGVFNTIANIVPRVIAVMSKLGQIVGDTFKSIINSFGNGNGNQAMTILNSGLLGYLLTKLKSLTGSLTSLVTGLKGGVIANTLNQLRSSLFAWQKDLEADALLKLAGAVAILVTSLVMLTGIDLEDLAAATMVISGLFAEMVIAMGYINKFTSGTTNLFASMNKMMKLGSMTSLLTTLAISVGVLAIAVKSLASVDAKSLRNGMIAVTILLGELVAVTKLLNDSDATITKGAGKLILLAAAVDLLAIAVKALGNMDLGTLGQGLIGVGALLGELVIFAKLANNANLLGVGAAMIPLAAGLDLLVIAIKVLGGMDLESLAKGLGSVEIIFLELAGFSKLVNPVRLLAIAASMIPIAAALDIMTVAIAALGAMKLESLAKGLGSVAVLLAEIGVFTKLVNPVKLIGISTGLLVFSAALVPFSVAMATLSLLSWEGIIKGFVALAGALTILGVASAVLAPMIVPMLGVGAALMLIGTAAMAAGAGVALIATALVTLAGLGVAGVAALAGTLTALAGLIPTMVHMLKQLVDEILTAVVELAPKFAEVTLTIIDSLLNSLAAHMPSIVKAGADIIIAFFSGMVEKIPEIATVIGDFSATLLIELGKLIPKLVDAGWKMIIEFINGMANAIVANTPAMIDAVNNLMESVVFAIGAWIGNFINGGADITGALIDGIKSVDGPAVIFIEMLEDTITEIKKKISDVWQAGKDFVQGFINGIKGNSANVETAAANVGAAADKGLRSKKGIDAHSPSEKVWVAGEDFDEGVRNGIKDNSSKVEAEAANMGDRAGKEAKEAFEPYTSWIEELTAKYTKKSKNADSATDAASAKKEQIEANKKLKESTEEATKSEEEFTEATKGSGKAAKDTSEDVKDLSNAFKAVEKGSKVSLTAMSNNLKANIKEHYNWVKDVNDLVGKGYDKAVIDWVKKSGEAGHETVKALKNATQEEVADLNKNLKTWLDMDDETEKILSDKYGESGAEIAQSYIDSMGSTFDSNLAETLQKALDPFGEFDKKTEKGAAKLLQNMKSQVEGFQTWGGMINDLQHRNLNANALEYLIGLGTSGYEDVQAIFQMTDDQIAEFNTLWEQQEHLGEQIAGGIQHEMNLIALGVNEGFKEGVDPSVAYDTLQNFAQKGLEGATSKEGFDEHSPSKKMINIGKNVVEGLKDGVKSYSHLAYTQIIEMAKHCIDVADDTINYDAGVLMGEDLMKGLKSGIERGQDSVFTSISTVCQSVIDKANEILGRHSPSRVFAEIGRDIDRGMALGIERSQDAVSTSIETMADDTISKMSRVIAQIAETVDNEMSDISPVITPRVDLTALQNGKSFIDSIFGRSYSTGLATSISPYSNPVAASINNLDFTPTSNADVVSAIGRLRNDLNAMTEQLTNMQVVLDGRTVVGELAPAMDNALGMNAMKAGRGN